MMLRVAGIVPESITDGPGLRYVVFAQGCPRRCEGCHNQATLAAEGGTWRETSELYAEIIKNPLISGVTFSGGEPFAQAGAMAELARLCRAAGLEVCVYTGYTFEELFEESENDENIRALLDSSDIMVDGPYIAAKRSLALYFRGSRNQRILNLRRSLEAGRAMEETDDRWAEGR